MQIVQDVCEEWIAALKYMASVIGGPLHSEQKTP